MSDALVLLWLALVGEKLKEESTYLIDCQFINYAWFNDTAYGDNGQTNWYQLVILKALVCVYCEFLQPKALFYSQILKFFS